MDVETTSPIHHLIFGGGIVRGCAVLCVIDTYSHRWETDKRSCFSRFRAACSCRRWWCSSSVLTCVACMKRMPVVQMSCQPLRSAANVSSWSGGRERWWAAPLFAPSGAKRECSHRKSALKASPSTRFSAISACRDIYLCQR